MFKVIKYFTDLEDNRYPYHVGDTFPHKGMEVSEERLAELSSDRNKRGIPLIKKVETEEAETETVEDPKAEEIEEPVETSETEVEKPVEAEEKAVKKPSKKGKKG